MGASIVDALDTLLIMGLEREAQKAIDWISSELDFEQV
jgi:mannosyl-oligosaccharide alpha-1,2-mannosidase